MRIILYNRWPEIAALSEMENEYYLIITFLNVQCDVVILVQSQNSQVKCNNLSEQGSLRSDALLKLLLGHEVMLSVDTASCSSLFPVAARWKDFIDTSIDTETPYQYQCYLCCCGCLSCCNQELSPDLPRGRWVLRLSNRDIGPVIVINLRQKPKQHL